MSFKAFMQTNRLRFFFITLLAILSGGSGILAGYFQMYWLTDIKNKSWHGVIITTALMALCWFMTESMIYYVQYLNNIQEEEYFKKLRDQIAAHYFKDNKFHKVSAFQSRLTNDFEIVKNNFFEWYVVVPFYGSRVIASLIALLTIHWSIFLLSIVIDLLSYYLPKIIDKQLEKTTIHVSDQNKAYLNTLDKWFSGLAELRRYFAGSKLLQVQGKAAKKLEDATVDQIVKAQLLTILNGMSAMISTIALLGMTGVLVENNLVIFGAILSVQNFTDNVALGMQQTVEGLTMMRSTQPLMKEISNDTTKITNQNKTDTETPVIIETQDLTLKFQNGERLSYPDVQIKQGEKILLTGDSGVGKSTLFKLILGVLKPTTGKVKFKNIKGEEIKPDLAKIGYIPQDPNLFPGTIKQNITMFNANLNGKVDEAVRKVNLATDLTKFKDGVNEEINLDKLNISGGQRQKIVLARARVHDSEIILIDEGTSAIDQRTTLEILRNLLNSKATIVFIAHNLSEKMRGLFDREIHLQKSA